jgi:TonB-dependent SusC/RagA subfamily outer membrane receptor
MIMAMQLLILILRAIESINVLKGSAATALYGSRASAGVIMITTRKGKILNEGENSPYRNINEFRIYFQQNR